DGSSDVAVMNRADPLCRVPLAGDRVLGQVLQVAVPVAVDEWEAQHGPVEPALAQRLLGRDFTGRIRVFRIERIVLASRMRVANVIDVACACEDEASLRRM